MLKTSEQIEQEFLNEIASRTGRPLQEWLLLFNNNPLKIKALSDLLKTQHGLKHMESNLLAGIILNGGLPVYQNQQALLEAQFERFSGFRQLFDVFAAKILYRYSGSHLIPKKTYLSFTGNREFLAVNISAKGLRAGLDIAPDHTHSLLETALLKGPMPRFCRMVTLKTEHDLSAGFMDLVDLSYQRSHS
jgi:hypothetical protein